MLGGLSPGKTVLARVWTLTSPTGNGLLRQRGSAEPNHLPSPTSTTASLTAIFNNKASSRTDNLSFFIGRPYLLIHRDLLRSFIQNLCNL